MSVFSERLKVLWEKEGITADDIVDFTGISRRVLFNYLKDGTDPGLDKTVKLADLFCVSIDYLTGRTDDTNRDYYIILAEKKLMNESPKGFNDWYASMKELNKENFSIHMMLHMQHCKEAFLEQEEDPIAYDEKQLREYLSATKEIGSTTFMLKDWLKSKFHIKTVYKAWAPLKVKGWH